MKYCCYWLLTLAMVGMSSCSHILDKQPLDFLEEQAYYDTVEKLESSLAGVYDQLGAAGLYGHRMLYRMGMEADEGYYARASPPTGPHTLDFTAGDADVNLYWTALYTGITRANTLLANIDTNPEISQQVRNRIRGEALFLRGYYYFMLAHVYGGVPVILTPTPTVNDVDLPRATVQEVYDQVLTDMKAAEPLVPGIRQLGFGGRVNKSAVRGVLARVCLYMAGYPLNDASKFAEAREWALKVIEDTEANHTLIPEYSQIFINYAQDSYDISESIWEVEFRGNASDAYSETGAVGYLNGPASSNSDIGEGFGGVRVTDKLYHAYHEGDTRRDWNIANFRYNSSGTKSFMGTPTPTNVYARTAGKFRREFETLVPKARTATPQNFPLLRYADVLLMFAEADNELNGPTVDAISRVNEVRRRAWSTGVKSVSIVNGGTGYTSPPTVTFSGGGGVEAEARAVVVAGRVEQVAFNRDPIRDYTTGYGYTSAPTALFEGGGGSGAVADVTIYQKSDADLTVEETATQEDFREAIREERFRELAFETQRRADLIRWGLYVVTMQRVGDDVLENVPNTYYGPRYKNASEKHVLWPIPAREMSLNMLLEQNPGW